MTSPNSDPVAHPQLDLPQIPPHAGSNGSPPYDSEQDENTEEFNYDPVPPKKTITVSVRYRIGGLGQPLPYPLDEGDGE
ncbi:MAG TPA: hypothetical protein VN688_22320 [Gemmataceae bacterium]|nr:hypothetical protein [Gemmataceae bacterium]